MPFVTGVASSPANLVAALASFASANGWAITNTSDGHRVFSKGSIHGAVATDSTTIFGLGATGAAAGSAWAAQPGASSSFACNVGTGPFASHTFYSSNEGGAELLLAVIEIAAGIYRHFVIGELVKFGTYTGGQFIDGTHWFTGAGVSGSPSWPGHRFLFDDSFNGNFSGQSAGLLRCDLDGLPSPTWLTFENTAGATRCFGDARGSGLHGTLYGSIGWQRYNLNTPLFPIIVQAARPAGLLTPVGRVPHMRIANMRLLFPGQILNIGGDSWQVWPVAARTDSTGSSTETQSGYNGFAVRRVP